ncbi:MAG: FkbM family methyltransferase [Alphaproteobacteria bacterium]
MPSPRVLMHAFRALRRNQRAYKHEPETPYLEHLLSGAPVCLHVGASDGRHSFVMAQAAPAARIYAFEPSAFAFNVLKTVIGWHGLTSRVTPVHAACSNEAGEMLLVTPRKSSGRMGRAYAFISPSKPEGQVRPDVEDKGFESETTPVVTLDRFCAERGIGRVDFIRMDIEGAEGKALAGASGILERDKPSVLLEIHPDMLRERFAGSAEEVVERFLSRGYRMFALNEQGLEERRAVVPGLPWKDYFFIHPSRASALPEGVFADLMRAA